jgi:hypothetical protein
MTPITTVKPSVSIAQIIQGFYPATAGSIQTPTYYRQVCVTSSAPVLLGSYATEGLVDPEQVTNIGTLPWGDVLVCSQVATAGTSEVLPTAPTLSPLVPTYIGANWDISQTISSSFPAGFVFKFSFGSSTVDSFVGLTTLADRYTKPNDLPISVGNARGVVTLYHPSGQITLGNVNDGEISFVRDGNNNVSLTYVIGSTTYTAETSPGVAWSYKLAGSAFLQATIYMPENEVTLIDEYEVGYLKSAITCDANLIVSMYSYTNVEADISVTTTTTARLAEQMYATMATIQTTAADRIYSGTDNTLQPIAVDIRPSDRMPSISGSIGSFAYPQSYALMTEGLVGTAESDMAPMDGCQASNKTYAESSAALPYLTGYSALVDGPQEASIYEVLANNINRPYIWETSANITQNMNIETAISAVRDAFASILSEINTNVNPVVIFVTDASFTSSVVIFVSDQSQGPDTWASWVVNYETNAHWRYDNFEFNSFAKFNGKTYGCKDDGIYELTGATDSGTAINAKITTPVSDFDSSLKKRMLKAYLGVKSDGDMVLKVLAEGGNVYYYGVDNTRSSVGGARINIGRGLTSRYWQFELMNSDGADFELDAIEFFPVITSRREM